jgi:hypothetical protein
VVPGAGLEPARSFLRGILSPLCLPIPPPGLGAYYIEQLYIFLELIKNGGWGRNRTGVDGFAIRCITTLLPSQKSFILILFINKAYKNTTIYCF